MIDMEALAMEAAAGTPMAQEAYDEIESLRKQVEAVDALPEKWLKRPLLTNENCAHQLKAALKDKQE